MARFTIYTYLFKPINEPSEPELFPQEVKAEESMERKHEIFGSFFRPDTELKFRRGNQRYEHLKVAQANDIIVMQIANNSHITKEQQFNRWKEEDHPSLYVLLDIRENRQLIAIENRVNAFTDTVTVKEIMEETFNRMLAPHRLQLQINAKYHIHEFWDVVSQYDKGIASVTFKFPYPNMPAISDMVGSFYNDLAKRTNSEPKTTLTAPTAERMKLEPGDPVIEQMIKAASASGKLIMMRPKGERKWRRIGLESPVQEELHDTVLQGLEQQELFPRKWKVIEDFMNKIKTVYE